MRRYLDQRLKLPLLRAADVIAQHGSISKASKALGVSQPALTKSLRELEDILQTRLFERHSRGVRITAAGERVLRSSRKVLAELSRLEDTLDELSSPEGWAVAVGALPVAANGVLPGVLARLKDQHPGIRLRLQEGRTEDLLPLLDAGELDVIVGRLYAPPVPDGFAREPLWSEPISLLARAGHPILGQQPVTAAAIAGCELVLPTITQRVGQDIAHFLARLDLAPVRPLRSNSYGFIREMLHSTDMLSAMPRLMMVGDLLRGTLRVVPLAIAAPDRPAGLILARDRPLTPPAQAFATVLRDYIADLARRGLVPPPAGSGGAGV
ncbi:LysR substrate-binding domain-containing protein [Thalassobaculum sp.]|uniref:LysR substrate-binding domain-containing protein n=1 Tax=Thalassobaculum sp. TaxID=2022740 RepID=UPI0032ED215B